MVEADQTAAAMADMAEEAMAEAITDEAVMGVAAMIEIMATDMIIAAALTTTDRENTAMSVVTTASDMKIAVDADHRTCDRTAAPEKAKSAQRRTGSATETDTKSKHPITFHYTHHTRHTP